MHMNSIPNCTHTNDAFRVLSVYLKFGVWNAVIVRKLFHHNFSLELNFNAHSGLFETQYIVLVHEITRTTVSRNSWKETLLHI